MRPCGAHPFPWSGKRCGHGVHEHFHADANVGLRVHELWVEADQFVAMVTWGLLLIVFNHDCLPRSRSCW